MIHKIELISDQKYEFFSETPLSKTTQEYTESTQATLSPLATKLFGFPWTQAVEIRPDSLVLTKQDWVEWEVLLEPLKGLLSEHIESSQKPMEENPQPPKAEEWKGTEEAQQIESFLKDQVNPSLSMHGGWAELKGLDTGKAYILMGGGCQGCGQSQATLKEGIEVALKEQFSFIQSVIDVTDHAAGTNPYY